MDRGQSTCRRVGWQVRGHPLFTPSVNTRRSPGGQTSKVEGIPPRPPTLPPPPQLKRCQQHWHYLSVDEQTRNRDSFYGKYRCRSACGHFHFHWRKRKSLDIPLAACLCHRGVGDFASLIERHHLYERELSGSVSWIIRPQRKSRAVCCRKLCWQTPQIRPRHI